MATSALHRELGVPASTPVSYDLLAKLVTNEVREQADLDFKQTFYHHRNNKDKTELVKDVCAMANGNGGWIICGIGEQNSCAHEIVGVDPSVINEANVNQLLRSNIDPPLHVDIYVQSSQNDKTNLVAIRVPDSPDKPHLMKVDSNKVESGVRFPKRNGPSTVWLTEREIREMYRASFNLKDEKEEEKASLLQQLCDNASDKYEGIVLVLLLVPQDPRHGSNEKEQLQKILQDLNTTKYGIGQVYSFLTGINIKLKVGDRRYIAKKTTGRFHSFVEVHHNGAVGVAIQLSKEHDPNNTFTYLGNEIDETSQNVVESAIIEAFNCARQISQALTPVADCDMYIHLVAHKDNPIIIRKTFGSPILGELLERSESTPIKKFRIVRRTLEPFVDEEKDYAILTGLMTEVLNQGGIESIYVLQTLDQFRKENKPAE